MNQKLKNFLSPIGAVLKAICLFMIPIIGTVIGLYLFWFLVEWGYAVEIWVKADPGFKLVFCGMGLMAFVNLIRGVYYESKGSNK